MKERSISCSVLQTLLLSPANADSQSSFRRKPRCYIYEILFLLNRVFVSYEGRQLTL